MAVDYVRVVFRNNPKCINVDIDGRIRTYSDIAEAAAVKHLGMTLLEAHIPAGALDLSGPVAFTEDLNESVLASLGGLSTLSLGRAIDRSQVGNGAWFLLEIASAVVSGACGSMSLSCGWTSTAVLYCTNLF